MVTKGYGFTVDDIDWSCPSELEPYAKAHNMYFPDCAYGLVGFAKNRIGKTCAVLSQPFILSGREATEKEISDELRHLGFDSQMDGEYFTNGIHDIFDAVPNNVLVGIDGNAPILTVRKKA